MESNSALFLHVCVLGHIVNFEAYLVLPTVFAISVLVTQTKFDFTNNLSVYALNIEKYCFIAAATTIASHSTAVCKMLLTVLIQR